MCITALRGMDKNKKEHEKKRDKRGKEKGGGGGRGAPPSCPPVPPAKPSVDATMYRIGLQGAVGAGDLPHFCLTASHRQWELGGGQWKRLFPHMKNRARE